MNHASLTADRWLPEQSMLIYGGESKPPAAIIDAIGRHCSTCAPGASCDWGYCDGESVGFRLDERDGESRYLPVCHVHYDQWSSRQRRPDCPDCFDGRATIIVRVPYEHEDYGLGSVELRVVPTAILPIVKYGEHHTIGQYVVVGVPADSQRAFLMNFPMSCDDIDLGPDPERYVGMFLIRTETS